jgi:hypothetical protein
MPLAIKLREAPLRMTISIFMNCLQPIGRYCLVDGAVRLGELLEGKGAEGLLVLGEILPEDVP